MIKLLSAVLTRRHVIVGLAVATVAIVLYVVDPVYAWLFISSTGLIFSIYLVNESRLDVKAMGPRANGRLLAAHSRGIRETIRGITHALYIVAGLIALGVIPVGVEWIVPILVWGAAGLMANSAIDMATRPHLYATRDDEPPIPHSE